MQLRGGPRYKRSSLDSRPIKYVFVTKFTSEEGGHN